MKHTSKFFFFFVLFAVVSHPFVLSDKKEIKLLQNTQPTKKMVGDSKNQGQITAIVNATIYSMDGKKPFVGTVLLQNKQIIAVGKKIEQLPSYRVVDGKGLWLTPGISLANTTLGLEAISMEKSTVNLEMKTKESIRTAYKTHLAIDSESLVIPVSRVDGITSVIVVPVGGLVSGVSSGMDLSGDASTMFIHRSLAFHGSIRNHWKGSTAHAWLTLQHFVEEARFLKKNEKAFERGTLRKLAFSHWHLRSFFPALSGKTALVLSIRRARDLLNAIEFAKKNRLRLVLHQANEGWKVAKEIAKAKIPVLLTGPNNLPSRFDQLGNRNDNAALLYKAGVQIAFASDSYSHHIRGIRHEVGIAVAWGLPHSVALRSLTSTLFEIFPELGKRGKIMPRFTADLVLWSGDPFETSSVVKHLWIAGKKIPLVSRQTLLRQRYQKRLRLP